MSWARLQRVSGVAAVLAVSLVVVSADLASGLGPGAAVSDAAVGVLYVLAATATRFAARRERILVAAVGLAWLVGGIYPFAGLHRAVLIHALLAFPDGRLGSLWRRLAALAAYLAIFVSGSAALSAGAFALAALVALAPRARPGGRTRSAPAGARLYPVLATSLMVVVLGGEALLDTIGASPDPDLATVFYEVALALVAVAFPFAVRAQRRAPTDVADLVVQLSPGGGLTAFADALAVLADDPSLRVTEWDPTQQAFVDERGAALEPVSGSTRILRIDDVGQPLAAVRHDASSLTEPGMVHAVEAAVRLAVQHAHLRRQEQDQIHELNLSRNRLLASTDAQRRRVATRLRVRVEEPAGHLARFVDELGDAGPDSEQLSRRATAELRAVVAELEALTRGLRPPSLDEGGLSSALHELAHRSALPVRLQDRLCGVLPSPVETVAYFVCAEALANATKHAGASLAVVTVEATSNSLQLSVRDDGAG
ncbi:MAG TPA: hypothetical protein VIJ54_12835, partial [Actinomycetes bacterium]